ncbi:hypothetical protein JCM11641_007549 [Rhodosporidiobolus odoratus]
MAYLAAISRSPSQKDSLYDAVDDLPSYPEESGSGRSIRRKEYGEENDEPPTARKSYKGEEGGPMTVDSFSYQLGRMRHDLKTLRSNLAGIPSLVQDARALSPSDNSLVAQSLLEDLSAQTIATADLLSLIPPELRTLSGKLNVLKPAAGQFLVSSGEMNEVKTLLAECGDLLRLSISEIKEGVRKEDEDKQQARMRLLKQIKATTRGRDDSEQMGMLMTAEREGAAPVETLKSGSYGWRWAVEQPYSRFQASLNEAGDLSFLSTLKTPCEPAPSSWANPISYLPTLPFSLRPPQYSAPGEKSTTVDGSTPLHHDHQDEEDRIGNFGEPLDNPTTRKPPKRKFVAVGVFVVMGLMVAATIGVLVWSSKGGATAGMADDTDGALVPVSTVAGFHGVPVGLL